MMPSGQTAAERLPEKAPDLITRKIAGEFLIVPVRGNLADLQRIYSLSPVAQHIWQELDRQGSFSGLRRSIVERFAVGEHEAAADLRVFLAELSKAGLVTPWQQL